MPAYLPLLTFGWCYGVVLLVLLSLSLAVGFQLHNQHSWKASSHISEVILTPIKNQQNLSSFQNRKGIGNQPDPFRVGTYNLQSIAKCPVTKKGLVSWFLLHGCNLCMQV